ncbi:hypothetical protein B6U67_03270, partial [Methanosarcinales archaeon ex4484_138]
MAILFSVYMFLVCGLAGAADYGNIDVTTANDETWSTLLSNNVSSVAGDIVVNDGAVLSIENATIKMDSSFANKRLIIIHDGGVMNINGSTVTHKDTSNADYYGWIYESGSKGNVTNSTIECCVYNNGFSIETNESVSIYNCTFRHGDGQNSVRITTVPTYGIYLHSAGNTSIRDCTIEAGHTGSHDYSRRYWYGIYIQDSNCCSLLDNIIAEKSSYYHGIRVQNSNNNTLENISITREQYSSPDHDAVHVESSFNNTLRNFTIAGSSNLQGIYVDSSDNTTISNSTINGSSGYGINIISSQNNILRSNSLTNIANYSLYVTGNYNNDIDVTNTVNGGRVYYNYTDSNVTIVDANIGHVTIVDCSNLWFDSSIIHNGDGVRIIGASSNVSIRDSTIENNTMYGINFESTSQNNITSVTIENNTKYAVYLVDSSKNTINDSYILNNKNYGIFSVGSTANNNIINNSITNNSIGVYLDANGY